MEEQAQSYENPQEVVRWYYQSPERLRLLLVLTAADIRAVGPNVWNGWKGQLLRDLYHESDAAHHIDPAHVPAAGAWLPV